MLTNCKEFTVCFIFLTVSKFTGSQRSKETRHVRFSDGIHPGVDQGDLPSKSATNSHDKTNLRPHNTSPLPPNREEVEVQGGETQGPRRKLLTQAGSHCLIPHNEGALPPIVCATECKGGRRVVRCW